MIMNYITVYDPVTGRILETHASPGEISLPNLGQVSVPLEADFRNQYIVREKVQDRPTFSLTLDGKYLKGVPKGASVTIEGTVYTADGSRIELEFSHPGTYKIGVSMFPYMDEEVTYENQP